MGNRVYLQNTAGSGATEQERVMCFDADTGKLLWEHKFNIFMSDVPPHRVGWASPAADPATGNIFAISVGGLLMSLSRDGTLLWERSLAEEFGMWTTHGGRMSSPAVDGNLVIVSGLTFFWGESRGAHRFLAFDKTNGQTVYTSAPEGRPTDTIYSSPLIATVAGVRQFINGGSDGAMHAIKVATGEALWNYMVSKRGLNTDAVIKDSTVIITHSEENLATNEMGMIAAVDATGRGALAGDKVKWTTQSVQVGYPSPIIDGDRIYAIDNGANLLAFDFASGRQLWLQNLGTIQKSSPVFADGKLYAGTENGKFFIIRPGPAGAQILDEDWLGTEQAPEAIIASPAISNGHIYVVSVEAMYAIGRKGRTTASGSAGRPAAGTNGPAGGEPAHLQVTPTELTLDAGEAVTFHARLFDANGTFIREDTATWSLEGLKGTIQDGRFTAATGGGPEAGTVKATIGSLTGSARLRVIPPLPWSFDFETMAEGSAPAYWVNTQGKFVVRAMDGGKVLVKTATNPFAFVKRCRPFFGPTDLSNYTIEADVRAMERRRQRGDLGIVAQRYALVLFGAHQRLELEGWQPETQRTARVTFEWTPDTWYRMKLRVENTPDGKVRARGKVWPTGQPEPDAWTIERVDSIPNLQGAAGLYADAPSAAPTPTNPQGGSEIYFDNIRVYKNQ
jgi:outer membrane protein assembly factor BamB